MVVPSPAWTVERAPRIVPLRIDEVVARAGWRALIPPEVGTERMTAEREWAEALTERGGFEPPMDGTAHTGFRDRRIQPLCHLSG